MFSRPWRTFRTPPLSGAENMAIDEALLERARRTGECVLRTYAWAGPTLSFGRHQLVRERVDLAHAAARGVDVVRRPTGGRALLHHREVTYSVTAPLEREASVREWYDAINGILLDALRRMGVSAEPAVADGRTPAPGSASCFQRPDDGEIAVDGRKLVGSALLRERGALLQHGSILLEDDQAMLAELLPAGDAGGPPAASLSQALGRVVAGSEVEDALADALLARVGSTRALRADEGLLSDVRDATDRYAGAAWTLAR